MISAAAERRTLLARSAPRLVAAVEGLARAHLPEGAGDPATARRTLARVLAETLALSNLFARRRVVLTAERLTRFDAGTDLLPSVTFGEAVTQLAARTPTVLFGIPDLAGMSIADRVAAVYARGGFTLAKATEQEVVGRVHRLLTDALERGTRRIDTTKAIAEMGDWTLNYANTVYENAVSTAYSAGTFQQMADPDVRRVIGALRFDSIPDSRRTDICQAFDGTVAPADHPIWEERTAPCHHRCRSGIVPIDWVTLRREGYARGTEVRPHIPNPGVKPQEGFGRRRDVEMAL